LPKIRSPWIEKAEAKPRHHNNSIVSIVNFLEKLTYYKNFNNDIDKNAHGIPKNKNYKKTEIVKNDGRYLIYYDFSNR
jgi:hypothetical protein